MLVQMAWKKPHQIITLPFSEVFFQVKVQANIVANIVDRLKFLDKLYAGTHRCSEPEKTSLYYYLMI